MTREMEIESDRWSLIREEAKKVGIDPNNKKFNRVFRAIALWGESLSAVRLTQDDRVRARAAACALAMWKAAAAENQNATVAQPFPNGRWG